MQTLWLSKGDHSALTPAQLLPSLPALPFLPISPPVLINLYFINLIPIDVWHQGIELKAYKINECEEKHEAIVQERKCSQREWVARRRKQEFLGKGGCEGRGQRSVSTVWWGRRAGTPRSVQEAPGKEGEEGRVEMAAWQAGVAVQDCRGRLSWRKKPMEDAWGCWIQPLQLLLSRAELCALGDGEQMVSVPTPIRKMLLSTL